MKYKCTTIFTIILILIGLTIPLLTQQNEIIVGEIHSTMGVKTKLNFHCFNSGYITNKNSSIPFCLKESDSIINCKNIKATGKFKESQINSDKLTLFYISKYKCLE